MTATATRQHPLATCRPLGDRVVVKLDEPMRVSPGGIALPDSQINEERPQAGTVVSVGPGRWVMGQGGAPLRLALDLQDGQRVLFTAYAGADYKPKNYTGDERYLVLREEDILVVLADDEEA